MRKYCKPSYLDEVLSSTANGHYVEDDGSDEECISCKKKKTNEEYVLQINYS